MNGTSPAIELFSTLFFALAIVHVFFGVWMQRRIGRRWPTVHRWWQTVLIEPELIFAVWAIAFVVVFAALDFNGAVSYLGAREYAEPIFVFCADGGRFGAAYS